MITNVIVNPNEKELVGKLISLVNKYGFNSILSALEILASDNTTMSNDPWEKVRKNLEDSFLEIEEYAISDGTN